MGKFITLLLILVLISSAEAQVEVSGPDIKTHQSTYCAVFHGACMRQDIRISRKVAI